MINQVSNIAFIYKLELKNRDEALRDEYLILSIQEELGQFEKYQVLEFVCKPECHSIIGTK
jgi:hypothetical protein